MTTQQKQQQYQAATQEINAILAGEENMILKMATINCVLKQHLDYYYWVGFYCMNQGALMVGPYQGTLGCLHIPLSKGVCGRAARLQQTQIVTDVHADPEHLACDSLTNSEIVLPVFDPQGNLIAVFDVDSTQTGAFDTVDEEYLTKLLTAHFKEAALQKSYV